MTMVDWAGPTGPGTWIEQRNVNGVVTGPAVGPLKRNGRDRRIVSMGWYTKWMDPPSQTAGSRFGATRAGLGGREVRYEVFEDLDDIRWKARRFEDGSVDILDAQVQNDAEWKESLPPMRQPRTGLPGRHAPSEPTKVTPLSEYVG